VLPAEFAAFTFTAIGGSAILYGDFESASLQQLVAFGCGCIVTFIGVYFITSNGANRSHLIKTVGMEAPAIVISSPSNRTRQSSECVQEALVTRLSRQSVVGLLDAVGSNFASVAFQHVIQQSIQQNDDDSSPPFMPDNVRLTRGSITSFPPMPDGEGDDESYRFLLNDTNKDRSASMETARSLGSSWAAESQDVGDLVTFPVPNVDKSRKRLSLADIRKFFGAPSSK
jgi:hypothetical protein